MGSCRRPAAKTAVARLLCARGSGTVARAASRSDVAGTSHAADSHAECPASAHGRRSDPSGGCQGPGPHGETDSASRIGERRWRIVLAVEGVVEIVLLPAAPTARARRSDFRAERL